MAKKCMIARAAKREKLIAKYAMQRRALKALIKSSQDYDEIMKAEVTLRALPLNSNPVRHNTTCMQCGRSRAIYRKFGLCRICLRQQLMAGNVPGGRKSSW